MSVNETTTHNGFPLPNKDNTLEHDVERLGDAISQIDTAIFALNQTQNNLKAEQNKLKESVRKMKLNALVGETVVIP